MTDIALNTAIGRRLLPRLGRLRRSWGSRRELARACDLVPAILATIPPQKDAHSPAVWSVQRAEWTGASVAVITVGPERRPPTAVLKLTGTGDGPVSLQRHATALAALHGDPRLGEWRAFLPKLVAQGEIAGQTYVVEQALSGRMADTLVSDPGARVRMQIAAAATIGQLHRRTASSVVVDTSVLDRWINQPLRLIRRLIPSLSNTSRNDGALHRLATELNRALAGRTLSVSWIHGDFWPRNVLVSPDGAMLTGIVDWDRAAPEELPLHDLLHLLVYTRKLVQRRELGDVLRALLCGARWTSHERALLDEAESALPGDAIGQRAMVLIYWLRHVAGTLAQSSKYARSWLWVTKNVKSVLRSL